MLRIGVGTFEAIEGWSRKSMYVRMETFFHRNSFSIVLDFQCRYIGLDVYYVEVSLGLAS